MDTFNRAEFRKTLRETIEKYNIQGAKIEPDMVIIATPFEDFDMNSNELWELDANKSYPRDVHCPGCGKQLVMSNGAFEAYEKYGRKNVVVCIKDAIAERFTKEKLDL